MYYRKDEDCDKCKDCINNPGKDYCNTTCEDKDKNCYESYKVLLLMFMQKLMLTYNHTETYLM